jgi:hypothetical protein
MSLSRIRSDGRISRRRLSRAAKVRLAIVLCINGILFATGATSIVTTFRAQRADPVLHYQAAPIFTLEHVLWLLPLLLGIVAELFRWRVAKFINVGYFAVTAVWMLVGLLLARFHVWGFAEPEHWAPAVMLIGTPAACVAVLLGWLYRVVDERTESGIAPEKKE